MWLWLWRLVAAGGVTGNEEERWVGKKADFLEWGGIQVAIGAPIALRDGRGLRCVLWYVCLSPCALPSRKKEVRK